PSIPEFLARTNSAHPRLWVQKGNEEGFRRKNARNPEALNVCAEAEKLVGQPLPQETPTRVRDTTGMSELDKKATVEFMYHGFGTRVSVPVEKLCTAYMLTGK